ncbi:MAG: XdhC family protein, partial [Ardenticatenaceae bacterium]
MIAGGSTSFRPGGRAQERCGWSAARPPASHGGKTMREVMEAIKNWREEGKGIALATVVSAEGSAPRREGAKLAVS